MNAEIAAKGVGIVGTVVRGVTVVANRGIAAKVAVVVMGAAKGAIVVRAATAARGVIVARVASKIAKKTGVLKKNVWGANLNRVEVARRCRT